MEQEPQGSSTVEAWEVEDSGKALDHPAEPGSRNFNFQQVVQVCHNQPIVFILSTCSVFSCMKHQRPAGHKQIMRHMPL